MWIRRTRPRQPLGACFKGWACIWKPPLERPAPLPDSLWQGVPGVGGAGGRGRRGAARLAGAVCAALVPVSCGCVIPRHCMRDDFPGETPELCARQRAREGGGGCVCVIFRVGSRGARVSLPGQHRDHFLNGGMAGIVIFVIFRVGSRGARVSCPGRHRDHFLNGGMAGIVITVEFQQSGSSQGVFSSYFNHSDLFRQDSEGNVHITYIIWH